MNTIKPPITEAQFLKQVIQLAKLRGWLVHHQRPAMTRKGWRSAIQGDAGFPDLVLVRGDALLFVELKRDAGPLLTAEQVAWQYALLRAGATAWVWRPRQWAEIEKVLM